MTKEQAQGIVASHEFHSDRLAEAINENDQDEIAIHQRAIDLMERDYQKASKMLE